MMGCLRSRFAKYLSVFSLSLFLGFAVGCSKPKADEQVGASGGSGDMGDGFGSRGAADFSPATVYFGYDQATLTSASQSQLNALVRYMNANPRSEVQVVGHCDERGSAEYNLALGARRAQAVAKYLRDAGISSSRVSTASMGEEQPAVEGGNEAAWAKNRRAEFVLTN